MNKRRQLLFTLISGHGIWQDPDIWKILIQDAIAHKIEETTEVAQKIKERKEEGSSAERKGVLGKLSWAWEKFSWKKKNHKEGESERRKIEVSSVLSALNQYTFFFCNFPVKLEIVSRILLFFGKRYALDFEKVSEMELEVKVVQPIHKAPEQEDPVTLSILKRQHERSKYESNGLLMGIGLSIRYVSDQKTLLNILRLSKKVYGIVKQEIFKQILIVLKVKMSLSARAKIWMQILNLVRMSLSIIIE